MTTRICEAGCGLPIDPPDTAVLLVEDQNTKDEYVGFMHAKCRDERFALIDEIKELLRIP